MTDTTYTMTVERISNGAVDRDGGLAPQYACTIRADRPAGISGPVVHGPAVHNYTVFAEENGFTITAFPEISTNYAGNAIAEFTLDRI